MMRARATFAILLLTTLACSSPPSTAPTVEPVAAPLPSSPPETIEEALAAREAGDRAAYESGLRLLAASGEPAVRQKAIVMLALALRDSGGHEEAAGLFEEAAAASPALAPFLLLQGALARDSAGQPDAAARLATQVIASFPASTAVETARIALPRLHALAGDPIAASAAAESIRSLAINELNDSDFLATAEALDRAGLAALAAELRYRLLSEYPAGSATEAIYRSLRALPPSASPIEALDFSALVALADRLGRVNRYDQALDLLARIEERFPQRRDDPQLRFVRTTALFNSRNYDRASAERTPPGDPYHRAIEILRGRAHWRAGRNAEFVRVMESVIDRFPKSKEAATARVQLSKYYSTDENDLVRAAALLREVIAAGEYGRDGENLWSLGWTLIVAGRDEEALKVLDRYLERYPDADYTSNALFWSAKVDARNGRTEASADTFRRLIARYPYSYFSYRARLLTGDTNLPPSAFPSAPPFPSLAIDEPGIAVVDELIAFGLREAAAKELRRLLGKRDDPALAYRLADLYVEIGEPLRANILLQRSFRDVIRRGASGVPPRFWQMVYPLLRRETMVKEADRRGIDPWLAAAVTRQESGFDPNVVSRAGAVGLMQLMPAEAIDLAARSGIGAVSRDDLFDPEINIALGVAELREKIDAMNGNEILAIAAYNAGESSVGRWLAQTSLDDIDVFIESIPFQETRLYVKSVIRNRYEYERVYGRSRGESEGPWPSEPQHNSPHSPPH